MSVRPHGNNLAPTGRSFMKFYVSEFFDNKSVKKYQLSLKSDKNSGHLARRPMGIYTSTAVTVLGEYLDLGGTR